MEIIFFRKSTNDKLNVNKIQCIDSKIHIQLISFVPTILIIKYPIMSNNILFHNTE